MDNFDDYKKFFDLRDKYPEHLELVSELMSSFFLNKESFPNRFFISGMHSPEDVCLILKELGICNNISCSPVYIRKTYRTYISIS